MGIKKVNQDRSLMSIARSCTQKLGLPIQCLEQVCIGENGIFRVETKDREFPMITLRMHRISGRSRTEIEAELTWVMALYADDLPVPRPLSWPVRGGFPSFDTMRAYKYTLPLEDSEWGCCSALTWLTGAPITPELDTVTQSSLGKLLARLHNHACEWIVPKKERRPRLRANKALGHSEPVRFAAIGNACGKDFEVRCRKAHARMWPILAALPHESPHGGLVHCDLVTSNLLIKDKELRVVDFDDACYAPFLYDIVTAAYDWLDHQPNSSSYMRQLEPLCVGYAAIRPLPPMTEQQLESLVFIRALGTLSWSLQRANHSQTSPERYSRAIRITAELLNRLSV